MLIITQHRSHTLTSAPLYPNERRSDCCICRRGLKTYTHTHARTQTINVSPYHLFGLLYVFVCVCTLNFLYIYLCSAEVMGFGSCVILFDLLLTYDEFCCTSSLEKNECGALSAVSDRHISGRPL